MPNGRRIAASEFENKYINIVINNADARSPADRRKPIAVGIGFRSRAKFNRARSAQRLESTGINCPRVRPVEALF